ncbi:hypothetical protein [Nocardioides sp.]|uniref:hypothetical protein n=1 Tax=Nocardioides sp. TaxID=35761 RepID=UPI00351380AA
MSVLPIPSVVLPPDWPRRSDAARGVVVTARAPHVPQSGWRPEITLRRVRVPEPDLEAWRTRADAELDAALQRVQVQELDSFDLLGEPVRFRRFLHREGLLDVVAEQWCWWSDVPALGRLGTTLTCTAACTDYEEWCDLFEAVAESVELPG